MVERIANRKIEPNQAERCQMNPWSQSSQTYLSEDETSELLAKVLDHVVSLGFTVDKEVKTSFLLELDRVLDLSLHSLLVSRPISSEGQNLYRELTALW